jgi:polysaccharide pyruvyl transferase CsaB
LKSDKKESGKKESGGKERYRFVVSGYYGCGNAGDEAVLAGIRDGFRRQCGDRVALTALSQRPNDTRALHGIDAADRMDIRALRATIARSDLLISGGGSLLQDTTSFKSLLYYLFVMRIAISCRVPVMFYAQGIGPLRRGISRKLVRMTANRAAYITVRDEGSAELLREIGVSTPTVEVTADPAFALDPAGDALIEDIMAKENIPRNTGTIGVALRPWGDLVTAPIDLYMRLLAELESLTKCRCILLPMHHPDDVDFARRLTPRNEYPIIEGAFPPNVVLGLVSQMSMVVAMRLHTLIFAARTGVPPFALVYDPKVHQLMKRLDLVESTVGWNDFDPAEIASQVANTLSHRVEAVAQLHLRTLDCEAAALRNCDAALRLVGA